MNETPGDGVCLAEYCEVFEVCHGASPAPRQKIGEQEICQPEALANARKLCEEAVSQCFPFSSEVTRRLHGEILRKWCNVLDCKIRAERRKDEQSQMMPVIVLLILIVLVGFLMFSLMVCCVDYSEDIFAFMQDSGLSSFGCIKRLVQTRETTRQAVGMDRTKCI